MYCVIANELVILKEVTMLKGEKSGMVKCPGVIGWKTLMPIPGMDSVGKCPTFAWVGGGSPMMAGIY